MSKIIKRIFSSTGIYWSMFYFLSKTKIDRFISDKKYLSLLYRCLMSKKLNLENPQTFNEKIQWLKLYYRNPIYHYLVDKASVKQIVAEKIGRQYVIETIGVWDRFEDIIIEDLPNQFVLKTTHSGGNSGVVICKDKSQFDIKVAKLKLNKSLKESSYWPGREWPYKSIKPRIIAEPYLSDNSEANHEGLTDYKFSCFNGMADNVMVCIDRHIGDTKFYFFDKSWNLLRINKRGLEAPKGFTLPKPEKIDEMFDVASKLSEGFPYSRVDLYYVNNKVYFGEITFFPDSGFDSNLLPITDEYIASKIILKKY